MTKDNKTIIAFLIVFVVLICLAIGVYIYSYFNFTTKIKEIHQILQDSDTVDAIPNKDQRNLDSEPSSASTFYMSRDTKAQLISLSRVTPLEMSGSGCDSTALSFDRVNMMDTKTWKRKQHITDSSSTVVMSPENKITLADGIKGTFLVNCRLNMIVSLTPMTSVIGVSGAGGNGTGNSSSSSSSTPRVISSSSSSSISSSSPSAPTSSVIGFAWIRIIQGSTNMMVGGSLKTIHVPISDGSIHNLSLDWCNPVGLHPGDAIQVMLMMNVKKIHRGQLIIPVSQAPNTRALCSNATLAVHRIDNLLHHIPMTMEIEPSCS
jgi:hypothetical protein